MTIVTGLPLRTYTLDPPLFFDGQDGGLSFESHGPNFRKSSTSSIRKFVRSPEGRGLAVMRENTVETWHIRAGSHEARYINTWPISDRVIVLDFGKRVVLYDAQTSTLTLRSSTTSVSTTVPALESLFSLLPTPTHTPLIGITTDNTLIHIHLSPVDITEPTISVRYHTNLPRLPHEKALRLIIPVDPMAWSYTSAYEKNIEHDILLSISDDGELAFWNLDEGATVRWSCTGRVRTGKVGFRLASCSSNKKSVLGELSVGVRVDSHSYSPNQLQVAKTATNCLFGIQKSRNSRRVMNTNNCSSWCCSYP